MTTFLGYFVVTIFFANILWRLKRSVGNKYGKKISYAFLFVFALLTVVGLFVVGSVYVKDAIIFIQLLIFISDAKKGKLFMKHKGLWIDLPLKRGMLLIAYNLYFVPSYFIYILWTFPSRLSEPMDKLGEVFVVFFLILFFVWVRFTKSKLNLREK